MIDKYCIYSSSPSIILEDGLYAAPNKPAESVAEPVSA